MQLRAILADRLGRDSLIVAGTGSGKTLPTAVNILLDHPLKRTITITISPLKRLQSGQAEGFNSMGINTVVINEDTPPDEQWWKDYVFNTISKTPGSARHLIVTPEQLFRTYSGHFPHLSILLRKYPVQKHLARINVDEVHFLHTAGVGHYGLGAFRDRYDKLDSLKAILPSTTRYIYITSNRPNTTYATHRVVKGIDELSNFRCLVLPERTFSVATQPRTLIFVDNRTQTRHIAHYLNSLIPANLRDKAFTHPHGVCRIMVATSNQATGIDFPDVDIVVTVGLPDTLMDTIQRAGRAYRKPDRNALFLVMYEPWIDSISLEDFRYGDLTDPDRPRAELKKSSKQRDRIGYMSAQLLKSSLTGDCIRRLFASYLVDDLAYTTPVCCSTGHSTTPYVLQDALPGPMFTEDELKTAQQALKDKSSAPIRRKYRKKSERSALDLRLIEWLKAKHLNDPYRSVRPPYFILTKAHRKSLIIYHGKTFQMSSDVTHILGLSSVWANQYEAEIFEIIQKYDMELEANKIRDQELKKKQKLELKRALRVRK
ncbi:P-loop containing nucleoside triphosphate hydrolase protein [Panaeolus papilionaceus]|nr:P-loop containing nucleoside triphosphate hydrolase protein [Panaeolus papilionaceus]